MQRGSLQTRLKFHAHTLLPKLTNGPEKFPWLSRNGPQAPDVTSVLLRYKVEFELGTILLKQTVQFLHGVHCQLRTADISNLRGEQKRN